jgi:hypothetical protein
MRYLQPAFVFISLVLLAVLAGCSTENTTDSQTPKPPTRTTATTLSTKPQASLEELKTINTTVTDAESPVQLAISGDASMLALLVRDNSSNSRRLDIYSTTSGKQLFQVPAYKYNTIEYIAWNPKKPVLAFYSSVGETSGPDVPPQGFGFIDVPSKRVRTFLNLGLGERVPFDWMPNASEVVGSYFIVNAATGKVRRFELENNPFGGMPRNLTVSSQRILAGEVSQSWQSPPNIYLFKPQSAKFEDLRKVGELTSKTDYDTNETTIRTQPRFLANGRLGYVWARLDAQNKPKAVEVRTSNENGSDERSWVKLPILEQGAEKNHTVAPATWTADGKTLALVDGKTVRIFKVVARS